MTHNHEIRLPGSSDMPRILVISWNEISISVHVFSRSKVSQPLAYASASHRHDNICLNTKRHELWLAGAAFDLKPDEARRVQAEFEPLGLRISEQSSVHSTPPAELTQESA